MVQRVERCSRQIADRVAAATQIDIAGHGSKVVECFRGGSASDGDTAQRRYRALVRDGVVGAIQNHDADARAAAAGDRARIDVDDHVAVTRRPEALCHDGVGIPAAGADAAVGGDRDGSRQAAVVAAVQRSGRAGDTLRNDPVRFRACRFDIAQMMNRHATARPHAPGAAGKAEAIVGDRDRSEVEPGADAAAQPTPAADALGQDANGAATARLDLAGGVDADRIAVTAIATALRPAKVHLAKGVDATIHVAAIAATAADALGQHAVRSDAAGRDVASLRHRDHAAVAGRATATADTDFAVFTDGSRTAQPAAAADALGDDGDRAGTARRDAARILDIDQLAAAAGTARAAHHDVQVAFAFDGE